MAILETEVSVGVSTQMVTQYENLGYKIPRRLDARGRMRVARNTVITVKVTDLSAGSHVRVTKVCDDCGGCVQEQSYSNILSKRDNNGLDRCKSCARALSTSHQALQRARAGHNLADKNPEAAVLWHPNLNGALTPSEVNPKARIRAWWLCDENGCGHEWESAVSTVSRGSRCPICSMPKGERRIREYIRFLGYDFTHVKKYDGLLGLGGGLLSYDFVVSYPDGECALLIEFDGIQHAEPRDMDGKGEAHALEAFRIQVEHDRRKDEYARLHNIPLLRIAHTEFDDTERLINEALAKAIRGDQLVC